MARIKDAKGNILLPATFLPVIKHMGMINNLTKYHLDELKAKVLMIKYPPEDDTRMRHLTEDEIMRLAFEKEI